jgi:hypothetical protein
MTRVDEGQTAVCCPTCKDPWLLIVLETEATPTDPPKRRGTCRRCHETYVFDIRPLCELVQELQTEIASLQERIGELEINSYD